jgi:hypothetical protein
MSSLPGLVTSPQTLLSLRPNSYGHQLKGIGNGKFGGFLDKLSGQKGLGITRDFNELKGFEKLVETKSDLSLKELLAFQVKAARLHFHVEACTKVADAAVSTVKRFQSMR